jgi:glycosyltransferase involved in cell wall biosynthesis
MCRLLPFWKSVFEELDITPHMILALRSPDEVFGSLRNRSLLPGLAGFSITCADKSHLLWLRHVLESEHHTRGMSRVVVTYDGLLADSKTTCERIIAGTHPEFRVSLDEAAPSIDAFLSTRLKHHVSEQGSPRAAVVTDVYELLAGHADGRALDLQRLDDVRSALNAVEAAYAPLRAANRLSSPSASLWETEMLERLSDRVAVSATLAPRPLFLSAMPDEPGHVYRIVHHAAALKAAGIPARWLPVAEADDIPLDIDVLVVWRAPWDERLARLYQICRARNIPVGFDIDDLVFDPAVMSVETWDYLRSADEQFRRDWLDHLVPGYARTLSESDFALVSTEPLARAARAAGKPAYVLPNGLDQAMIASADAALADPAARPLDGHLRLGYVSGTPTHQKDFAEIVPVLASLLQETPNVVLTIVGWLAMGEFPELMPYRERIELRPLVPFGERFREYARFDINLAPLQGGNPFCEGKSELRYYEPALVNVPTVASATLPFQNAIKHGETGFCARTIDEWYTCLRLLVHDPTVRSRLGRQAHSHAVASFGPDAQSAAARRIFLTIRGIGGTRPHQ